MVHSNYNAAVQAFQGISQTSTKLPNDTLPPDVIELFEMFLAAYEQIHPEEGKFTAVLLHTWACSYAKLTDTALPQSFKTVYSLGKLMRKKQKQLSIIEVGSYGNRVVYMKQSKEVV